MSFFLSAKQVALDSEDLKNCEADKFFVDEAAEAVVEEVDADAEDDEDVEDDAVLTESELASESAGEEVVVLSSSAT